MPFCDKCNEWMSSKHECHAYIIYEIQAETPTKDEVEADPQGYKIYGSTIENAIENYAKWNDSNEPDYEIANDNAQLIYVKDRHGNITKWSLRGEYIVNYYYDQIKEEENAET